MNLRIHLYLYFRFAKARFMDTKELGNLGEKVAKKFLEKKGYKILNTNFKRKWGEIDIVAQKTKTLFLLKLKLLNQILIQKINIFFQKTELIGKRKNS